MTTARYVVKRVALNLCWVAAGAFVGYLVQHQELVSAVLGSN